MKPLTEKVALVTGAGSGIGRATALAFSEAGATVVVSDISVNSGEAVAEEIIAVGGNACFIHCDVSDRVSIKMLIAETVKRYGQLDCAFNNAGVGGPNQTIEDFPDEDWDNVIATNLSSTFFCMKHEIRQMLKQGSGTIVNCSSVCGKVGLQNMPAYSASKHGILGLTKTCALDYATQGIRINAVCPGVIHTPAVDSWLKADPVNATTYIDSMIAAEPIGRLGNPEEVASAVVWLCSPGASFMIGSELIVDGGFLAQ